MEARPGNGSRHHASYFIANLQSQIRVEDLPICGTGRMLQSCATRNHFVADDIFEF